MTPRKRVKKPELWSFKAGGRGYTVTVSEREPGGYLYASAWNPEKGYPEYVSVRHKDKERAKDFAREEAERLRLGRSQLLTGVVTVGYLLDQYLEHRTPEKKARDAAETDRRQVTMWKRVLGEETAIADVTLEDWKRFVPKRLSGAVDQNGRPVPPRKRKPVSESTVAHDGMFIRAVFYWGMSWATKGGGMLVARNPFGAPAKGVRSAFVLPKGEEPDRPVVSDDRYEKVRAVARQVLMRVPKGTPGAVQRDMKPRPCGRSTKIITPKAWYAPSFLYEMVTIAWETGRRRDAWRTLLASDLRWGPVREEGVPVRHGIVAIYWKPTKHEKKGIVVPVTAELRRVLEEYLQRHPRIGKVPLFPSTQKPDQPIDASFCDKLLHEAEELAGVGHFKRWSWHAYRRAWATRRKHLPLADVMAGAGWKTERVVRGIYQQTSDLDLVEVLENARRIEERKA